ncbi:hypothetical protein [Klenkia sp. PcliD-1-E]|uniref:hypothetical protein n=1 Tax=Klenkia sp. PcliD-1-E TaxID=2954492 RepID=UPI0020980B87|nr:hypothetical protein [Klenkia sp. PcliD-1-E]MCO7221262.1 hypothetical protein [Klenkia sp. PcliD-1-E]
MRPPVLQEWLVLGSLAVLAVVGLLSPGRFNAAPAELLLEVAFFLASLSLVRRMTPAGQVMLVLAGGYVLLKVLLLLFFGDAGLLDFLLAYKSFVYVALLGAWVGADVFDRRRLARFTTFLVVVFLLKYGYSVALGLADRPGVYLENNFELILLMGVFLLAHPHLGRERPWVFAGLAVTVLLSGSRSAALGLMVVYLFIYLRTSTRTWPLQVIGTGVVGYAVLLVFSARAQSDGGARLDRLNFLDTFLYEVRDWPLWEWLTGSFPLTPLSPGSCGSLAFYAPLFSKTDPGVCYSVILHSYFLRAVFDHGLLGIALLLVLLWVGLRRSGADRRPALALLALISVSGLSVSAFNNVFSAITVAICLAMVRTGTQPAVGQGGRGEPAWRSRE